MAIEPPSGSRLIGQLPDPGPWQIGVVRQIVYALSLSSGRLFAIDNGHMREILAQGVAAALFQPPVLAHDPPNLRPGHITIVGCDFGTDNGPFAPQPPEE